MRGVRLGLVVLAGWLAVCLPARAGVYNTHETFFLPSAPADIRPWLSLLREAALEADPKMRRIKPAREGTLRHDYARQARVLGERVRAGEADTLDRVNLSACYLRMRRYDDAIGVLKGADPRHFLVLTHLATAYADTGELNLARLYQQQALKAWPDVFPGWNTAQLQWYRRAELHFLKLLDLRLDEQRRSGGRGGRVQTVDLLFGPRVQLVAPSGQYEAGALRQESIDHLPPDATNLVLQLVQWQPYDDRLYWLLAELLNTHGHVDIASDMLNELVEARQFSVPELFAHRKVLRQAAPVVKAWRDPAVRITLLSLMPPRGLPVPAGIGSMVQDVGAQAALYQASTPAQTAGPAEAGPTAAWAPSWRQLGVGFVFGGLLSLLGTFQWQEWRRRRQPAHPWSDPGSPGKDAPEESTPTGFTRPER